MQQAWYNIQTNTELEFRNLLASRLSNTEAVLNLLDKDNMDYINSFSKYVTINNPLYCNDLLQNKLQYIIQGVIGRGKVGEIALLKQGNISLIIKSIFTKPSEYLSLRILDHQPLINGIQEPYWNVTTHDGKRKILAVGGDNFANQTSMHLILNLILKDSLNYVRQYDAFYCNNIGYNVIEYCNKGDLHSFLESNIITDQLLLEIIYNVLLPLSILKLPMYNFNHSDLKIKNIFVHLTDDGKYIFKIGDYDKSSITWKGFRFYNWSQNYFASPVDIRWTRDEGLIYVLSSSIDLQLQTMHNPYGIPDSYDIYTFILSLFSSSNIWKNYILDKLPSLKRIVHILFRGSLYYKILGKIAEDNTKLESISYINSMLNGATLNYDIGEIYSTVGIISPTVVEKESIGITVSKDEHLCSNECRIRPQLNSSYKSCNTNTYSKSGFTSTTLHNWDYC